MKHTLYLIFTVAVLTACKKDKKETPVTINTLQGTWQEQLPVYSSMLPAVYTFRGDSTFTKNFGGAIGIEQGTFRLNGRSSDARILDVTLTVTGSATSTRYTIDVPTHNKIVITYGGTMGKNFARLAN